MNEELKGWNPRFVNYARVNGFRPEGMLEYDAIRFPGGKMAGFVLWNRAHIQAFKVFHPEAFFLGNLMTAGHVAYDAYLDSLPVIKEPAVN